MHLQFADDDWSDDTAETTRLAADFLRSSATHVQDAEPISGVFPKRDTIPALPLWMAEVEEDLEQVA